MNTVLTTSLARRWTEAVSVFLAILLAVLLPATASAQGGAFAPVSEVRPAPPLLLVDLDDKKFDLASLHGRVVVVNFWATWCPPCRQEFPSLGRLQKLFKPQDLTVLAVNVGEDADTVFSFTGHPGITVLLDRDAKAMAAWPVKGLPSTFVIDRAGRMVLRAVGGREFDDPAILAQLRAL